MKIRSGQGGPITWFAFLTKKKIEGVFFAGQKSSFVEGKKVV